MTTDGTTTGPDPAAVAVSVGLDELDRPGATEPLLRAAAAEAVRRGARLRVVHAVWGLGGLDELLVEKVTADRHLALAVGAVERQVALLRATHPGLVVETDVRHVRPSEALVEASRDSVLLVIGRHDPVLPIGSHVGPVAGAVLREAHCPVLVVGPAPEQ